MSSNQKQNARLPQRKSFAQVAAAANASPKQPEQPAKPKPQVAPSQPANTPQVASHGRPPHAEVQDKPAAADVQVASIPLPVTIASTPTASSQNSNVEQLSRLMHKVAIINDSEPASKTAQSDTKSVTSRTTLALDEKESLRPDDSASMQATAEDGGSLSSPSSAVGNSKEGSDPDVRAFRDQLHEIDRTGAQNLAAQRDIGKTSPPEVSNGAPVYNPESIEPTFPVSQPAIVGHSTVPVNAWNVPPDVKLLDALASPKDRLFVLKVEQDMIDFIKDSKEDCLQLPATNSFYRLLSHKLADYYLLGHVVDESMMSVRINRTPNCRLPPPLIGMDQTPEGSEPAPAAPARQIMRRNPTADGKGGVYQVNGSDKNLDSLTSSKATSDIGAGVASGEDIKDLANNGDKSALTREQRESRYNEARARIFKDFEATEAAAAAGENPNTAGDKGISRTSSSSGVKKNNKKKNKIKDDGFEARSAFDQYGQRIIPPEAMDHSQFNRAASYSMPQPHHQPPGMVFDPAFQGVEHHESHFPAYSRQNGYSQMPMQYWNAQGMPQTFQPNYAQAYSNPEPPSFHGYVPAPNNGYDASQYHSGNPASQATPKGNPSTLASYHPSFISPNENMSWNQGNFANPYGGNGYGFVDSNVQYSPPAYFPGHMMSPHQHQPQHQPPQQQAGFGAYHQGFSGQDQQLYGRGSPYATYVNTAHFNPRSQNFVPNPRPSYQQFSPDMGAVYPRPGQGPFPGSPSMQRHSSNTSHGSGYTGKPANHHSTNAGGMRPNGRGQSPYRQNLSYPRGPVQQYNANNSASNNNSISKWSTPANLPAKPPPPAVVSPYVDVPRDPDNPQPLPPKPFSAIHHNSSPSSNPNQFSMR